jgi:hypothetical protein
VVWEKTRICGSLHTKKLLVCEDLPHCKRYLGTCGPVRIINSDVRASLARELMGAGCRLIRTIRSRKRGRSGGWRKVG